MVSYALLSHFMALSEQQLQTPFGTKQTFIYPYLIKAPDARVCLYLLLHF